MTISALDLPDYENPPLVEVVFAISFRSMSFPLVDLARFGLERLGSDFPVRSEQPSSQMPIESFDGGVQMLVPSLSILEGSPPVRLWFRSENGARLVQLQRDWLACNWQDVPNSGKYPRYEAIEGFFLKTLDSFSEFVSDDLNGVKPIINQCELSYINHIAPSEFWNRYGQIGDVVRLAGTADDFLPEPEDSQVVFRYRIKHDQQDRGRLYVQALPALRREDRSPVIQLNMIARGAPLGEGREGALAFFRLAHEWIVKGFAAVTTDSAQDQLWGRLR